MPQPYNPNGGNYKLNKFPVTASSLASSRVLVSMIEDAPHFGQTVIKKSVTIAFVTLPNFGHVKP
jgi:hypothetical protein